MIVHDRHADVFIRWLVSSARWVLGAVFAYQLALLYGDEHQQLLRVDLKPF